MFPPRSNPLLLEDFVWYVLIFPRAVNDFGNAEDSGLRHGDLEKRGVRQMMISTQYRVIFVHIQKTAGTSVSEFLASNLMAKRNGGKHESAHEVKNRIPEETWLSCFKFSFVRNPWDRLASWYLHMKKHHTSIGNNPFFDYLLSVGDTFENFILYGDRTIATPWGDRNLFTNQFDQLALADQLLVDFVGKFESLESDWNLILDRIGYTGPAKLPHVNAIPREHYRGMYTGRARDLVEEKFQKDIKQFGYSF